jgi:hypothetical protein
MFSSHHEHAGPEHNGSAFGVRLLRTNDIHSAEIARSPELEGDFEAERHRAAASAHVTLRHYEHGDHDGPTVPGTSAGYTHP